MSAIAPPPKQETDQRNDMEGGREEKEERKERG